ncbi:MAG TPA: hypothetical protein GXZ82_15200 [Firmicutes bacterium]|jgi:hypothetical protein|nr:hypothetical protein [Bacillota bacterium]
MSQLVQREFLGLDDAAHAAQLQSKCFADYARRCQDGSLKELLQSCAAMHQRHFERLAQCIAAGQGQASATGAYFANQGQVANTVYGYAGSSPVNYQGQR